MLGGSLQRLAGVLLVGLLSLGWLPAAVESQVPAGVNTTLYSWCYYTASHRANPSVWSVYASGSLVASTFMTYGPANNNRQGFPVYYLSGTRVITLNGRTTSSIISGIAPQGSYMGNDNFLYPVWPNLGGGTSCYGAATTWNNCQGYNSAGSPVIPGGGISFLLDGQAPLGNGTLVSVVNINGDPMNEWPNYLEVPPLNRASNITGVSYFVFQATAIAGAINCQPPAAGSAAEAAATYSFTYVTSPVNLNRYLFSACVKAQVKMLGPFTLPTGNGTTGQQYVLYAANGTRTFVANNTYEAGYSQTANIIGLGGENGGDFRLYVNGYMSFVDYPGITFDTSSPPAMELNNATLDGLVPNYCHIYYTGSYVQEADWNDIEGAVAIQYARLGTNPALDALTCPNTIQAQSWSFCHYAQGPNGPSQWTVITYGTLITFPEASGGFLMVTAIGGNRTQTVGGVTSGPLAITGLIFPGGASNGNGGQTNDNLLSVTYPFVSYNGLAYNLATFVQLPPDQTGNRVNQSFVNLISDPPCEAGTCTWTNSYNGGIPATNGGLAYFLLQPSTLGPYNAANCGGPSVMPTTSIGFGYTASPQFSGSSTQYYLTSSAAPPSPVCTSTNAASCPLWSSCASITLGAIGPILYPGGTLGSTDSVYVIVNATGTRSYADVTGYTQTVQITGVSPGDGGDFNLFAAAPFVDDAGITFTTSTYPAIPFTDLRTSSANSYFNLWSPQQAGLYAGQTAAEAIVPGYLNNVAVIGWTVGAAPPSCPATYTAPQLTALSFCFYMQSVPTASAPWTVVTSGTLYGVPSATYPNSWYITGVTGTRAHYLGLPGYGLTLNDTVQLTGLNLDGSATNTLHTYWPFVDYSPAGFNFQLSAPVVLPGMTTAQSNVVYSDDPPYEVGVGSSQTDTSYVSFQLASAGTLSCGIQTGTSQLAFSYTATPLPLYNGDSSYGNWQSCAAAVLTVLGPFNFPQPGGTSVSAYQVVGASGYRTFTTPSGVSSTVAFASLNNGIAEGGNGDGSDNRLYTAAPYVDDAGITFATAGIPQWPNSGNPAQALSLQFSYVNLWCNGGLNNGATYATEAILNYTPNNVAAISFGPASNGVSQCSGATMSVSSSGQLSSTGSGGSSGTNLSHGDIAAIVICTVFAVLVLMALAACCGSALASRRAASTEKPVYNTRYQSQAEEASKNANTNGGNGVEMGTA